MTDIGATKDIIAIVCPSASAVLVALISLIRDMAMNNEINKLRQQLSNTMIIPLTLKNGVYFDKDNNPYCPACRANSLFMPLPEPSRKEKTTVYHCPKCNAYFDVPL